MVARRCNIRIFGPLLASLIGLAVCIALTTDVSERHSENIPQQSKPSNEPFLHAFGEALDHLRAKLFGAQNVPDQADEAEIAAPAPADRAAALGHDLTGLREAIAFYKSGDLAHGDAAAKTAHDALVHTLLEWVALRTAPREVGFDRLQAFQVAHPDWPGNRWIRHRMEAALYFRKAAPERIVAFFANQEPETVPGKLALARALESDGKTAQARALVRSVWHEAVLSLGFENRFKADFAGDLDNADHRIRADRLISKGEAEAALRAAALAGGDALALAKLRLAALSNSATDKMFAAIPIALQSDPDYVLAKVQKLRHAEKLKEAVALFATVRRGTTLPPNGDEWWAERQFLARKILDLGEAETAYKLCAEHEALSTEARIEAEFFTGWIALRFLNDPARAARHFAVAAELAETPISVARAAYWQGRAAEISRDDDALARARSFYDKAAAETSTYYGQIARERVGGTGRISLRTLPKPSGGEARLEAIRTVELLFAIDEKELALSLASEVAQHVSDAAQLAALAEVVAAERNAHAALMIGKILNQRRIDDDRLAYPTFGIPRFDPLENSAAPAVVYSVARQESGFDPHAVSSAGAKGLMQLIASTAKRTARHAGLDFDADKLTTDAAFNAKLGAAHLGHLLRERGGSYILTFAAYNAGPKRVKEWIEAHGDPRSLGVDPIDWVERIPLAETRNYVQRVMENLFMYRASFANPQPTQGNGEADNHVFTAAK
ncbi:MAG: lytic transglycosylase domain-containing protein [Beijerinckiaceae bacterium]